MFVISGVSGNTGSIVADRRRHWARADRGGDARVHQLRHQPDIAGLFQETYAGITSGLVSFEGKGARQVSGNVDAEAVLRGLGAAK